MLHLHHADELDPLLDALAGVLAVAPADPFTPDVVVVPAAGLRDTTMAGLGQRLGATGVGDGVVANVQFVFPGRFMAMALGDSTPDDLPETDRWRLPRLTWSVLDVLARGTVDVPRPADGDADQWMLARRIADLFDRYATQRPRLIEAWAAGLDSDGTANPDGSLALLDPAHHWQAELWRAVRAHIGEPSPPERLVELLAAVRGGRVQPALPERVSLFGLGGVAPTVLAVLKALGQVRDVHLFLRHPSHVAWQSSPHRLAGSLNVRTVLDVTTHTGHPLLASWGRPALEARALLNGDPQVVEHAELGPAHSTGAITLLQSLQQGIRLDQRPTLEPGVDAADGSLQVHACHGEVRQLEALRDALGHAFVADPTLAAHEVLVLCPDLERFAPLVEAVFARGALPVPVRIGDRSLTTDDPLLGALQQLLVLVAGRATLSEVLALVQFEPVRLRFGWSVDHVEQLAEWCAALGTRWGLSPEHRVEWGLPGSVATGTWRSMIDQLLAGIAMPAPSPRVVLGEVAPYDDVGSDQLALIGSLADLLARLVDLHAAAQQPRPVAEWVELLHRVVDDFCAVDRAEPWRRQYVHHGLDAIAVAAQSTDASSGSCDVPLTLADLRAALADSLRDRPGRLPLRSGSVTVSSLVPQHGVPARVVCLLGLDDGSMRAGTFDGDDVLGARPCVGERHPRHESRQLLLDAVLAAGDRLIITCNGADLTTNKETPFIVPLVELLDVVGRLTDLQKGLAPVVVRHPRHGFNERALRPGALWGGSAGPFTFDPSMLAAAQARRLAEQSATATVTAAEQGVGESPWALPPLTFHTVQLGDLVEVVGSPSKVYLRDRLEVRLPSEAAVLDDGLAVSVDPLSASSLGRQLLDARRLGLGADDWAAAARLGGGMPPGNLSTAAITTVRTEVEAIEALAADWGVPLVGAGELVIDQALPVQLRGDSPTDVHITGTVQGVAHLDGGPRLVQVRYTRPRPKHRLALGLQLAVLQRQQPDIDWSAVLISRGPTATPEGRRLRLRGTGAGRTQHAEALLALSIQLLEWARRDAVPLLDRTSAALAVGDISAAYSSLDNEFDHHATALWPGLSVDALLRDPIVAGDPPVLAAHVDPRRSTSRAMALARWAWHTYAATVEELDVSGAPTDGGVIDGGDDE